MSDTEPEIETEPREPENPDQPYEPGWVICDN